MRILSLEISGLGSYSPNQTTHFDFGERTLLLGPNGSGKSWVAEAISLCLFGKTIRRIDLDGMVNREGHQGECRLTFVEHKKQYRTWFSRNSKLHTTGNGLEMLVDGDWQDVTPGYRQAKVFESIRETTGLDWEVFRQSGFFGQNDVSTFLSGTDQQRRELLTAMLRLDRFQDAVKKVRGMVAENRQEVARLQGQIDTLESLLKREEGDPEELKKEAETLSKEIILLNGQRDVLHQKALEAKVRDRERAPIQREIRNLRIEIEKCREYSSQKRQQRERVGDLRDDFHDRYIHLFEEAGYWRAAREFSEGLKETAQRKFKEFKEQIDNFNLDSLQWPVLGKLTEEIEQLDITEESNRLKIKKLEAELGKLETPSEDDFSDKLASIEQKISRFEKRRLEALQEASVITRRKEEAKEARRKLTLAKSLLRQSQRDEEVLDHLMDAFGPKGLPTLLLSGILDPLTAFTNQRLTELGLDFGVRLVLGKETKAGELTSELRVVALINDQEVELGALSGGERQRVELALRLAIASLSPGNVQTLILDEVTTGIDEHGLHSLTGMFQTLGKQVISITHEEILAPAFDQVIRLEKRDGVTCVIGS